MNLLHTKKYAAGLLNLEPGSVVPYTVQETKNIVVTLDGHLKPLYGAKQVIVINDPLAPVKGYL